jgi:predicted transcriptional regulator
MLNTTIGYNKIMKVEEIASREVVTLDKEAKIIDAVKLMAAKRVGFLVLVDASNPKKPWGVVSERDIIKAIAEGEPLDAKVKSIATTKVIAIKKDEEIGKAAALMVSNNIRHLVVLDEYDRLFGVVSIRDLIAEKSALKSLAHYETSSHVL